MNHRTLFILFALAVSSVLPALGQTPRYGLATRVELHMLPAVTSTPLDPSWHPDGGSLAYSMRGDIWIQGLESDEARAVTQGPGYHYEPAWSPDGEWLAMAVDFAGQLDIAIVRGDGSDFRLLTDDGAVDVQPTWSSDGEAVIFASARSWDFDIRRVNVQTGDIETMVEGPGNQYQPAPSPDGALLAYIDRVPGRLGSGGIWTIPTTGGDPTLVHYEETSYRAAPTWTPEGAEIVFASDAAGSYDLATVPARGGNRVRLTSQALDEFGPAVSPDGRWIAFVGNQEGPTALYVTSRFGGGDRNWRRIEPKRLLPRYRTSTIRGRVVDASGAAVPARIQLLAADERGYVPQGAFHRVSPVNEIHYFHTTGEFEVTVPAGAVRVEAIRGFEWIPADLMVEAPAGGRVEVELRMERLTNPLASRWVSGDTHVHDLHEGRYALSQEEFFDQLRADDLHVANDLIHMDGTKLMGRWSDLTGSDYPGSGDGYILRYSQEYRGSFGHVGLLGVDEFIMPLIGGTPASPYPSDGLKLMYLDSIRALGGIGGFMHPYTLNSGDVTTPAGAAQSDIPVHTLLGRGDFYDLVSIASDEMASAGIYYHMLNVGVRIAATGGTDNFSNVWRDPSGGTARTYARIDGDLSWTNWIDAVRAGRTVATNGPLLFVEVDGAGPGGELSPRSSVRVQAHLETIAPVEFIEIVVDGEVVHRHLVEPGAERVDVIRSVAVEGARWIAVRARGGRARYSGDNYTFAHTTPVYFADAPPNGATRASAGFLTAVIEELWDNVSSRATFTEPAARAAYRAHVDQALARLRSLR